MRDQTLAINLKESKVAYFVNKPQAMKMVIISILSAIILMGALACSRRPASTRQVKIQMQRTACYGSCPVYGVQIFDDLSVIYTGEKNVPLIGEHLFSIKKKDYDNLIASFIEANFFDLKSDYVAEVTDLPTTYIEFTHEGSSKKIRDYYGAPEKLRDLEGMVEKFVSENIWK